MKKHTLQFVNTLLVSLLLAAPVRLAQAADNKPGDAEKRENYFDICLYRGASGKVNLNLAVRRSKRVTVTLRNAENEVVNRNYLKRSPNSYRLKYNFAEAKSGLYRFEISDGQYTLSREVEVVDLPPVEPQRYIVYNPQNNR